MKTVTLWILQYLVIPAGFMLATGLPQALYLSKNTETPSAFTTEDFKTLQITPENFHAYFDTVTSSRELLAKQNKYSMYLYFYDLKQLRMFKEKYEDYHPAMGSRHTGYFQAHQKENELWSISWQQVRNGKVSQEEITKARAYWLHDEPKPADPNFWTKVFYWLLSWFSHVYLRGLPIAFILFLIWKIKLKKDFDEEFRWEQSRPQVYFGIAPVSFFASLLLWPIVLGIDIRNKFQETLRRADVVSRRVTMFTLFSKQEEQLLELGKKMNIREFREHLDSLGMTRKHSLASAWCVMVFLIVVPTCLFPHTVTPLKKELTIMKKVDYGGGDVHYKMMKYTKKVELVIFETTDFVTEMLQQVFFITNWMHENDFSPDIGKVPWVSNQATYVTD